MPTHWPALCLIIQPFYVVFRFVSCGYINTCKIIPNTEFNFYAQCKMHATMSSCETLIEKGKYLCGMQLLEICPLLIFFFLFFSFVFFFLYFQIKFFAFHKDKFFHLLIPFIWSTYMFLRTHSRLLYGSLVKWRSTWCRFRRLFIMFLCDYTL